MTKPQIFLLTGDLESGKTSLSLEIADLANFSGSKVSGLVSPGVFSAGSKTAIDVQDLSTGERHRLAVLKGQMETTLDTKRWSFFTEAVNWGNQALKESPASDLLIIDELGPLEFDRGQGWVEAFGLVERGEFQAALLVIRPSLIHQASSRWNIARIINLSDAESTKLSSQALFEGLKLQNGIILK